MTLTLTLTLTLQIFFVCLEARYAEHDGDVQEHPRPSGHQPYRLDNKDVRPHLQATDLTVEPYLYIHISPGPVFYCQVKGIKRRREISQIKMLNLNLKKSHTT